jgi:hypothetical protein
MWIKSPKGDLLRNGLLFPKDSTTANVGIDFHKTAPIQMLQRSTRLSVHALPKRTSLFAARTSQPIIKTRTQQRAMTEIKNFNTKKATQREFNLIFIQTVGYHN